jgi:hypothetical protein
VHEATKSCALEKPSQSYFKTAAAFQTSHVLTCLWWDLYEAGKSVKTVSLNWMTGIQFLIERGSLVSSRTDIVCTQQLCQGRRDHFHWRTRPDRNHHTDSFLIPRLRNRGALSSAHTTRWHMYRDESALTFTYNHVVVKVRVYKELAFVLTVLYMSARLTLWKRK